MNSVFFRSTFWDDPFIRKLKPTTKLLYIYLITNKNILPSGIYEFIEDDCKQQTGIPTLKIKKGLEILEEHEKIVCVGDWIFIINFIRKAFGYPGKVVGGTIKASIANQFRDKNIPDNIMACFYTEYHTLSIPYQYPSHIFR